LNVSAKGNIGRYVDHSDNDYEDLDVRAGGTLDASQSLKVKASARYQEGHEDRGGDDVGSDANAPVEFDKMSTELGVAYKPNRLGVEVSGKYTAYDYDDNATTAGGITNNDDRDRDDVEVTTKVSYEVKKGYDAYVLASLNEREYDEVADGTTYRRDSEGFKAQAGMAIDLAKLVRADIAAGYMEQEYDASELEDADGWSADVDVNWFVTPLTTVRATVARAIDETTTANTSATLGSRYGVGVDHEFMRNLKASADVKFSSSEYEGDPNGREDDKLNLIASVDYKVNRNFFAGASVDFEDRDSNIDSNDYDKTTYMLKIGAQF